jgi:hypothetical protein
MNERAATPALTGPMATRMKCVRTRSYGSTTIQTYLLPAGTTFDEILRARNEVASGLGLDLERLVFEPAPAIDGQHALRLTILERGAALDVRLFDGPGIGVQDGQLAGVGRYLDESVLPSVAVWSRLSTHARRMVPLAVVGQPGTGRSNALRLVTSGVLGSEPMNLLVIDRSGCREPELRGLATVLLSGEQGQRVVWPLLRTLMAPRARFSAEAEFDGLTPTPSHPGWMIVFTDISATMSDVFVSEVIGTLRDMKRLGLWPVAVADSLLDSEWGSPRIRDVFAEQVIAFHGATGGLREAAGIDPRRATLPTDECGRPVPGYAVLNSGDRRGMPLRLDYVPGRYEHPLTDEETAARDRLLALEQHAELDGDDRRAIESVLGPARGGRWVVEDEPVATPAG